MPQKQQKFQKIGSILVRRSGMKFLVGFLALALSLGPVAFRPEVFFSGEFSLANLFQKQEAQATALTLYETNTAATTLTTADNLTNSAPSVEGTVTIKVGTKTGWDTLPSQGSASNWASGASEPAQLGTGFLWDVTTLEGQQILSGNWTPKVKISVSNGSVVADIHVRVAVRSSGGVYTNIIDAVSTGQTINGTATVYTLPATSGALTNLNTGDKLYQDVILNITTNSTGKTTATFTEYENGGANESVVTPGYQAQPMITLADGTRPPDATIGPGANAATSSAFTFTTNVGTSTITSATTTVATTTGVYQIQITDAANTTVYGSSTNPSASSVNISLSNMNVSTTATTFHILIKPLNAASMPSTPVSGAGAVGNKYFVTSTLYQWTDINSELQSGSNSTSGVITIDNLSPADVTNASGTAGNAQVQFTWTNPGDTDFATTTVLRATSSISARPTEGTYYTVGNTVNATTTVACVVASPTASCTDTGLTNNTAYYYMAFTADNYLNYSSGTVPAGGPFTPTAANPQISSAANQTFTVGTTNAISAITVTSTAASQITAANGIRITLATSTGAPVMFWNTASTTATIAGDGNVSTAVSYADASSTLVLTVNTDFANASSVTISGLSYVVSSTANTATTTRDLKWNGAGQAPPFVRDAKTVTIKGALDLGQHSAGQKTNAFTASATSSNAALFAFQLAPTGEQASTTLDIQLSSITGVSTGDITGAAIYKDANANGVVDGGDTVAWSNGSVTIGGATGDILFSTPFQVSNTTTTRFILVATTTNLLAGDTITYGLGSSNLNATGTTVGLALSPTAVSPPSGAVHTVSAASRTERSFRWQDDDGPNVNSDTAMAAADVAVTGVKIGQRLTLRMQVDNDGGGDTGIQYKLQYQANATSGAWSDVASLNAIRPSAGLAGSNNDPIISAVGAANARAFTNGVWSAGTAISSSTTLLNNNYTELGFMIDTANADTTTSTTYFFRVVNNAGGLPLDATSVWPSLTTVAPASNTIQYSKQRGTLPVGTSSLAFYFDDIDYANVLSNDTASTTITATSTNFPIFQFRTLTSTTTHPMKITWTGQQTNNTSTLAEIYRFGSTNAWTTLVSSSSNPVNSDFTLTAIAGATSSSEYYEASSSNFWSYIRVRQNAASTTASLRTNLIQVNYQPAADSLADQTFEVNDPATAISQLRVKVASTTPVVTAANDIRIVIPASLNMKWATSTAVAVLGGSASAKASTTVTYPNDTTLRVDVTTDFTANDDLTVSGLNFANFTSASASTSLQAFYGGSTSANPDYVDLKIKQIRGKYALGAHTAGQVGNKLDTGTNSVTDNFLNFQIAPTGENATNTQLVVNLTDVQGFATADVTSTQLFMDLNSNGAVDAGEPQVGSTGTVSISGDTGTITFSGSFAVTSTRDMILRATINNVQPGDGLNFSVAPGGFTATGQTSQIALVGSGTSQNARHNKPSSRGGGSPGEGAPPSVATIGGGTPGGGAPAGGGGTSSPSVGGGGSGGGGATP